MPFKVLTLWFVASPYDPLDVVSAETFYNLLYFARIMFYTNSAINPILYNIMSSKFREGFKNIFRKVTCKSITSTNYRPSTEEFESSAMKVHSRRSMTKDTSFEVLSDTVNDNGEELALRVEESARKAYAKRGGEKKRYQRENQNEEASEDKPGEDSVKAESILLIEEKQYRLIKAKGHFNI